MSSTVAREATDSQQPVRILIADDHDGIRRRVRSTLEQHAGFDVVGEAHDGAQAIAEAHQLKPDVAVLNVTMPVMNGFEAARQIKAALPGTAIVILSADADQRFIDEAKKIGCRAYVAKTRAGSDLIKAIEAALKSGEFIVMP